MYSVIIVVVNFDQTIEHYIHLNTWIDAMGWISRNVETHEQVWVGSENTHLGRYKAGVHCYVRMETD